jgi:hypothetical protein
MAPNADKNSRIVYLDTHQQFAAGISHGPYMYPKKGTSPYTVVEISDFQLYLPFVAEEPIVSRLPLDTSLLFAILMSQRMRASFIGDLEERYGLILKANSRRSATIWFWQQVILSFFSLALDAVKNLSGLEKLMRRIGS